MTGRRGALVRRRAPSLVVMLAAALATTSCSATNDPEDPPQQEMPPESTPVPDATEGVAPGLEDFYTQTLQWDDCGEQYQCSTMTVPLDYDEPDGDTVELALLRSPATSAEPVGSLLVNPGGPGASGTDFARNTPAVATEQIHARYDIVGFDPRGVGDSTPVECLDDEELDELMSTQVTAEDDDGLAQLEESMDGFVEACAANSSDLLPHVGTADVARDLDVMRAVLGDEKLNYLGKSYGTFIGAFYAELFPERVGRMVLDGAMDPSLGPEQVALAQAEGFERALTAFLDWCLNDDCPLGDDEQAARATLDQLITGLEDEPLPTNDERRPLTAALAFYGIILPLYITPEEGYPLLSRALDDAVNSDDGSTLLQLADLYLQRNPDGTYDGNQNEAIVAVNCLDRPGSVTVEEVRETVPEFEAASPIFGQFMAWGGLACADWPAEAEEDPSEISGTGAAPILVVGTTGDPATPYEWSEALAEQLDSGALLTYDGFVHTAYRKGSDCLDQAVDHYLLSGNVPDEGTVCS